MNNACVTIVAAVVLVSIGCAPAAEDAPEQPTTKMARFKNPTASQVPELTTIFRAGTKGEREDAAVALGTIGTMECLQPILEAISDADDYMRSYAMIGIGRGIGGHCSKREFLEAVFPALVKLLDRDDSSVSGSAPELLLAIDAEKAFPILISPQFFSLENSQLYYILRALNGANRQIPHDILLPLIDALKPLADKYPHDYQYSEALVCYGQNPDKRAEQLIRSELASANKEVREGAGKALAIYHGVKAPYGFVCEIIEKNGFDSLTGPQKHYYAVSNYDTQVRNGGHSQYFINSYGDSWTFARSGLKAIGANERAGILEEAAKVFGVDGPSQDRMTRIDQLGRLPTKRNKAFENLDERFYDSAEDLDVLLPLYAIENRSHFKAAQ